MSLFPPSANDIKSLTSYPFQVFPSMLSMPALRRGAHAASKGAHTSDSANYRFGKVCAKVWIADGKGHTGGASRYGDTTYAS
jgi:hypothetical protein